MVKHFFLLSEEEKNEEMISINITSDNGFLYIKSSN